MLVVIGMIAILTGAASSAVMKARKRSQIARAEAETQEMTNAILAYENFDQGGEKFELPELDNADADKDSLGFILGDGGMAQSGGKIPVLLMASLTSGGKMMDPWNSPYKVTIKRVSVSPKVKVATGSMQTGYFLPNNYRLSEGER